MFCCSDFYSGFTPDLSILIFLFSFADLKNHSLCFYIIYLLTYTVFVIHSACHNNITFSSQNVEIYMKKFRKIIALPKFLSIIWSYGIWTVFKYAVHYYVIFVHVFRVETQLLEDLHASIRNLGDHLASFKNSTPYFNLKHGCVVLKISEYCHYIKKIVII